MADLAIINATILTADAADKRHQDATMLARNGRIVAIGANGDLADAAANANTVIDARSMLVMPGLINTHCHIPSTLFRGLVEDLPLEPWLQRIWKAEAAILDPKTTHLGSLLGLAEMALAA